jgi:hypothetical protein
LMLYILAAHTYRNGRFLFDGGGDQDQGGKI